MSGVYTVRVFVLLLSLFFSSSVVSEVLSGRIVGFVPFSSGDKEVLLFKLDSSAPSGCNVSGRFAMDNSSPRFKLTSSAVIAAFHSQSTVKVNYLSSCNVWSKTADVNFICVGDINC